MKFDSKRIQQLIKIALMLVMRVYSGLKTKELFEHRGPFYFKATVELDGHDAIERELPFEGPPEDWETPFDKIARSKHDISQREGKDTVNVPLIDREVGDTQYWGSVVLEFEGGRIIVAISGLQPWFDEALSGMIARLLLGYLKHEEFVPRGPEPDRDKPPFLDAERLEELRAAA